MQYDLLVHRKIRFPGGPAPIYNLMPGRVHYPLSQQPDFLLPLPERVQQFAVAPTLSTPFIPNYRAMVEAVCDRIGGHLAEFRAFRVEVSYPPIPTFLVQAHPLAPGGS